MWRAMCLALILIAPAYADHHRSKKVLRQFAKLQACPSTGAHRLPCPGWQIDHALPLKCKGPDDPANLQWLTVAEHKIKTAREAGLCRGKKDR